MTTINNDSKLGLKYIPMMSDSLSDILSSLNSPIQSEAESSDDEIIVVKKDTIWINASDVAAITGYNQYADTVQLTLDYLYKGRSDLLTIDGDKHKSELVKLTNTIAEVDSNLSDLLDCKPESSTELQDHNNKIIESVNDAVSVIKSEHKKIITKAVNKEVLTADEVNILEDVKKSHHFKSEEVDTIQKLINNEEVQSNFVKSILLKKKISEADQEKLTNQMKSSVNRNFGTRKEYAAIRLYEQQTGNYVKNKNDQLYKLKFEASEKSSSIDDAYFWICGKVDGLVNKNGIKHVVEVKNRKNRIFKNIPYYDQIQATIYMKMLGTEHCDFVQCISSMKRGVLTPRIAINELTINEQLWSTVRGRLYKFIEYMYELRSNDELRQKFVNNTNKILNERCDWLGSSYE